MYSFEQIVELFDEDQDVIRQALTLYFEKYGGEPNPPYSDEVVGRLDEFFGLVNKSSCGGKILASSNNQIATSSVSSGEVEKQVESVLGVKGVALAVAINAAREGRALARLKENVSRTAFNAESNKVSTELLDSLDNEATWLEGYAEDNQAQSNLLKKLGIIQEESRFNAILELAIAKAQSKSSRPARAVQPSWGNYL